jgi:hypothetical protein
MAWKSSGVIGLSRRAGGLRAFLTGFAAMEPISSAPFNARCTATIAPRL